MEVLFGFVTDLMSSTIYSSQCVPRKVSITPNVIDFQPLIPFSLKTWAIPKEQAIWTLRRTILDTQEEWWICIITRPLAMQRMLHTVLLLVKTQSIDWGNMLEIRTWTFSRKKITPMIQPLKVRLTCLIGLLADSALLGGSTKNAALTKSIWTTLTSTIALVDMVRIKTLTN